MIFVQAQYYASSMNREVKDMQIQMRLGKVFARKNCCGCVTRTAKLLRFALGLIFLLGRAFVGCRFCRDEDGGAACGVASFAEREENVPYLSDLTRKSLETNAEWRRSRASFRHCTWPTKLQLTIPRDGHKKTDDKTHGAQTSLTGAQHDR